jgi:hypothetical protein
MNPFHFIYFFLPSPLLTVAVSKGPEIYPKPASRKVNEGNHRSGFKSPVNNHELGLASWKCNPGSYTDCHSQHPVPRGALCPKGIVLDLVLYCHCLKIIFFFFLFFLNKGPTFSFCTGTHKLCRVLYQERIVSFSAHSRP